MLYADENEIIEKENGWYVEKGLKEIAYWYKDSCLTVILCR